MMHNANVFFSFFLLLLLSTHAEPKFTIETFLSFVNGKLNVK